MHRIFMAGHGPVDVGFVAPTLETGAKGNAQIAEVLLPLPPADGRFCQRSLHNGHGSAKVIILASRAIAAEKEPAALT
jgi:hypothetical protein